MVFLAACNDEQLGLGSEVDVAAVGRLLPTAAFGSEPASTTTDRSSHVIRHVLDRYYPEPERKTGVAAGPETPPGNY